MTDDRPVDGVPPDLTDPVVRSVAVAAATREIVMNLRVCSDRARDVAAAAIDVGVRAASDFVKREGQSG